MSSTGEDALLEMERVVGFPVAIEAEAGEFVLVVVVLGVEEADLVELELGVLVVLELDSFVMLELGSFVMLELVVLELVEADVEGVEDVVLVVFELGVFVEDVPDEAVLLEDVPADAVALVELEDAAACELVLLPDEPDAFELPVLASFVVLVAFDVVLLEDVPVEVAVFAELVLDDAGFVVEVFGTATVFSLGGFGFSRV